VLLDIETEGDLLPFYAHTVFDGERPAGIVTSAAHGFRTGRTLALAYLRPGENAQRLAVSVLGQGLRARILQRAPYDPENLRLLDSTAAEAAAASA
jgi:dimethylglycine dehydrogenase